MSASNSLLIHDSDQHGEIDPLIDPPVDSLDRTDSLAFLLKHAMDLISTVLNGTEAQVSALLVFLLLPTPLIGHAQHH